MTDKFSILALLAELAVLCGLFVLFSRRRRRSAWPGLVVLTIVALFACGELLLLWRETILAALLFIGGLLVFLFARPLSQVGLQPPTLRGYERYVTVALAVAVIGVGVGLRFWRLGDVPYGVEQNEMEWTVGAAHATYTDLEVPTSLYQRNYLPMSSMQERVFFDAFGMDIQTARLENAVFSTAAIALFYLLVVQLSGQMPALIATFLLAISTLHVASARQAHGESHVLFWAMLSYLLFWLAVRYRSAVLFFATGVSVVLGLWTHETYNMTLAVIAGSLCVFAVMDWRRWRHQALCVALFVFPISLVAKGEKAYLDSHHAYHFAEFDAMRSSLHGPVWQQAWEWVTYLSGNLQTLFENLFVRQTRPAYEFPMIRPDGAMVLAAVLPLAALGLLVILRMPKRREHVFLIFWVALQLVVVPAALGAAWGRVLLPATPALFVLAGIGGTFGLQTLSASFDRYQWIILASTGLLAAVLVGIGARAYFYEVQDPEAGQIRRELVDVIGAQRDTPAYIIIPFNPGPTTPRERLFRPSVPELRFLLGEPPNLEAAEQRFRSVQYSKLLQGIRAPRSGQWATEPVRILMEHRNPDPRLPVPPEVAAVRACYDMNAVYTGQYFDVLEIPRDSLAHPSCRT